jgi:hypothetical protein
MEPVIPEKDRIKHERIMISPNYDLRGLAPKQETLKATPLCTGWMVFLNKRSNLAHIMHADDADNGAYVRTPFHGALKGCHPNYIRKLVHDRMVGRYIL